MSSNITVNVFRLQNVYENTKTKRAKTGSRMSYKFQRDTYKQPYLK